MYYFERAQLYLKTERKELGVGKLKEFLILTQTLNFRSAKTLELVNKTIKIFSELGIQDQIEDELISRIMQHSISEETSHLIPPSRERVSPTSHNDDELEDNLIMGIIGYDPVKKDNVRDLNKRDSKALVKSEEVLQKKYSSIDIQMLGLQRKLGKHI